MRTIPLIIAILCAIPALYFLAVVYTASPIPATISSRKMDIRDNGPSRGGIRLTFDMELQFRTASGDQLTWQQQLPHKHIEEALMVYDNYPPGKTVNILRSGKDVLLRRGLPDWHFGAGWAAAGFSLAFFLLSYFGYASMSGPWLMRPQRGFALMGIIPLAGGALLYSNLQRKSSWPHVQVRVEKVPLTTVFDSRGLITPWKEGDLETIRYQYGGREFMYPAGSDVDAYQDGTNPTFDKIVDPDDPAALSNIPQPDDDKANGVKLLLGFGALFLLLGLLIP
ncbi:MAG: hypothetical protein HYX27_19565 [Acidobacteria bacterium]|nr:hypothetical protein [Acidobacteriota bacterium]